METIWTTDLIEKVSRLWAEGWSAQQIGNQCGISKGSVIGKVHRLGLPRRPSPIGQTSDAR